jgi:cobalamin biosynthetic protein CobC
MKLAGPEIGGEIGDPIQHGGNLSRARALFPHAPEPWVDLSTGISPHSYPYSPLPDNAFTRLPDVASAIRSPGSAH